MQRRCLANIRKRRQGESGRYGMTRRAVVAAVSLSLLLAVSCYRGGPTPTGALNTWLEALRAQGMTVTLAERIPPETNAGLCGACAAGPPERRTRQRVRVSNGRGRSRRRGAGVRRRPAGAAVADHVGEHAALLPASRCCRCDRARCWTPRSACATETVPDAGPGRHAGRVGRSACGRFRGCRCRQSWSRHQSPSWGPLIEVHFVGSPSTSMCIISPPPPSCSVLLFVVWCPMWQWIIHLPGLSAVQITS